MPKDARPRPRSLISKEKWAKLRPRPDPTADIPRKWPFYYKYIGRAVAGQRTYSVTTSQFSSTMLTRIGWIYCTGPAGFRAAWRLRGSLKRFNTMEEAAKALLESTRTDRLLEQAEEMENG